MSITFGDYLREKRKERHFTIKTLARLIRKSTSYISQLESGIRPAPQSKTLEEISNALALNDFEKKQLYNLADKSRKTLSNDLMDYINTHEEVKETLLVSKECDIPEEEWQQFLNDLKYKFLM